MIVMHNNNKSNKNYNTDADMVRRAFCELLRRSLKYIDIDKIQKIANIAEDIVQEMEDIKRLTNEQYDTGLVQKYNTMTKEEQTSHKCALEQQLRTYEAMQHAKNNT